MRTSERRRWGATGYPRLAMVEMVESTPHGPTFHKLSVFYPMWNEEDYIERALAFGKRACEGLIERGDIADYELIVIDDKSTDRTPELADALAAADPHVRVDPPRAQPQARRVDEDGVRRRDG